MGGGGGASMVELAFEWFNGVIFIFLPSTACVIMYVA